MLHCIYHPYKELRVVEDEEKNQLVASGEWFDHPLKAMAAKERLEPNREPIARKKKRKGSKDHVERKG